MHCPRLSCVGGRAGDLCLLDFSCDFSSVKLVSSEYVCGEVCAQLTGHAARGDTRTQALFYYQSHYHKNTLSPNRGYSPMLSI